MSVNTNINLTSLDPNTLKSQMVTWFQNDSIFRDYNFSGSNINVLMDVLARNDFLLAFFLNMTFSEGFNDSAQLRDSLVSKAKELNYIPYSMKSSTTSLNITLNTNGNNTSFEIPKGTVFAGLNSNSSYTFVTDKNYIALSSNSFFQFSNVNIYEGFYQTDLFSVDNTVNNQLFTFSSKNIDTSSLFVVVNENAGSTNTIYTQAVNLYGLNSNSNVYFLQASSSNTYQMQFGDGVLGHIPQNGAIVSANYRTTNGDAANYVPRFSLATSLNTYNNTVASNVYISPNGPSSGGSQNESIDSIRFNNPRHYQTQDNAITANNYKTLILENFPTIADVNVYAGGISNTAVQFGMIFISLVTVDGNPATNSLKSDIQSFINQLDILNYQISFVDPTSLYLGVSSNVHVDFSQTNISPSQYKSLVVNGINNFSVNNLSKFGTPFRYSVFGDFIDDLDTFIISNETYIFLKKNFNTILNTNNSITITFNNPIVNVTSTSFTIGGNSFYLTDTISNNLNSGLIYLVQQLTSGNVATSNTVGTINYSTGVVNIPSLNISNFPSNSASLSFKAYPQNKDIFCSNSDIIQIDPLSVNINIANN
jgi:hypothetical protein